MTDLDRADQALDSFLARSAPVLAPGVAAAAAALPTRVNCSRRLRGRWAAGGVLAGVLTLGGTAAIAAPLLLQPIPGFTKLVAFSYGVEAGQPGIRCQTIIAIKPTPDDARYDHEVVARFSAYMRAQTYSIPVPAAARQPYPGDSAAASSDLYSWPGTEALNREYSTVMQNVYDDFDGTDSAGRTHSAQDRGDALSHSVVIQDSVSCTGHP